MNAYDERSRILLEQAALILACHTDKQRNILQTLYDLGRCDGALEQSRLTSDRIRAEWAAKESLPPSETIQ